MRDSFFLDILNLFWTLRCRVKKFEFWSSITDFLSLIKEYKGNGKCFEIWYYCFEEDVSCEDTKLLKERAKEWAFSSGWRITIDEKDIIDILLERDHLTNSESEDSSDSMSDSSEDYNCCGWDIHT